MSLRSTQRREVRRPFMVYGTGTDQSVLQGLDLDSSLVVPEQANY